MDHKDSLVILATLCVSIIALFMLSSSSQEGMLPDDGIFELTTEAITNATGDQIRFMGIGVGSTIDDAARVFGVPDDQSAYDDGVIVNLEYGEWLGYNKTVLIVHAEHGIITRITFQKPIDEHFVQANRFGLSKRGLYDLMGEPKDQLVSSSNIWLYSFPAKGRDYLLYEKETMGLSIYAPATQ